MHTTDYDLKPSEFQQISNADTLAGMFAALGSVAEAEAAPIQLPRQINASAAFGLLGIRLVVIRAYYSPVTKKESLMIIAMTTCSLAGHPFLHTVPSPLRNHDQPILWLAAISGGFGSLSIKKTIILTK